MAPKTTLYFAYGSPPARACLLLARYLKLDIEHEAVDLVRGEHHSEAFLKINPLHKVPVLVEGDFVLVESRAILAYLVSSRSPNSDLYPADLKQRALVDSRLYYDATIVFERLADLVVSALLLTEFDSNLKCTQILAAWFLQRHSNSDSKSERRRSRRFESS